MKKSISKILAALTALCLVSFSGCSKKENSLKIYAIIHEEETEALTKLFTEKTGIKTEYLRSSTGEILNRVIAEKDSPVADVLLGGASSYHIQASEAGALEEYASPVAKDLPEFALSPDNTWTGFCVLTLGIGINSKRFSEKFPGMEYPATWDDLVNPAFNGEIVLTNPVASSTAYLFVQNQLQRLGSEKGWEYLLSLSELVGQFPDSGSAPPKLVGTGEYALGVAYVHALSKYRQQGFDIVTVAPPESVGDVDCVSILKNTKNLSAARKFVDFVLSAEAQELMSSMDFTTPVNPDAKVQEGVIPVSAINLMDYDTDKAAAERKDVLEFWSKNVK